MTIQISSIFYLSSFDCLVELLNEFTDFYGLTYGI
jgi:hypothetical protein